MIEAENSETIGAGVGGNEPLEVRYAKCGEERNDRRGKEVS